MTKFKAKFSDGTIKERSSNNPYSHAWMVIHAKGTTEYGFSSSEKGAIAAANYEAGRRYRTYSAMSNNEKIKTRKLQAEHIKTCKIEVVQAIII
jgi:hypothetical protein